MQTDPSPSRKKSLYEYTKELIIALVLALVIAIVVRQMWFELYEIPSGSMRPTFREQDHLSVTKTQFGINIPLATDHFYFDPRLVERTGTIIFSGANIPSLDQTIIQFMVFPYTKRYVKRMIGKPGDSIYFYGGQLYGVDKDGNPIRELIDSPWMKSLEYVPMLNFGDLNAAQTATQVDFKKMGLPIGRIIRKSRSSYVGQIYNGKEWVEDNPKAQLEPHQTIETYSDYWGMRNYAMARLLTPEELKQHEEIDVKNLEQGILYLELIHDPSLSYPPPIALSDGRSSRLALNPYISVLPLQQTHLDTLMENMYTARFVVKEGKAYRYSLEEPSAMDKQTAPAIDIPDGTYEFYHGKAYQVGWGGILHDVPTDSPLYARTKENVQKLYNLGMEVHNYFSPIPQNTFAFPHRYAYFRNGDLYLLGAPLFAKEDLSLKAFHQREEERAKTASSEKPYVPFRDYGPPLKEDGGYDVSFIRTFGVTVPEKSYFVLGDNHAMSSDSREFGFVPQDNLQGVPSLILWPLGERWGFPAQKPYPIFTLPRLIIWSIVALIGVIWYIVKQRKKRLENRS